MKQYSIGEFAALNKITSRMLRHYDKIGLLKPAAILENGYRAYTSAQLQIVSSIRLYQNCGFSLAKIRDLLDADEANVRQAAKTKLAELDQHYKIKLIAWKQLLSLTKDFPQPFVNYYDISYIQQSSQLLFCCAVPVTEAKIEPAIDRLYRALETQDASPIGLLLLLWDLESVDAYRVALPVKTTLVCDGYECVALEAGWYLSTIHHGDYYNISMAYDRLLRYTEEKRHQLKYPFLERYLLDSENANSSSQYITQILIQLTP